MMADHAATAAPARRAALAVGPEWAAGAGLTPRHSPEKRFKWFMLHATDAERHAWMRGQRRTQRPSWRAAPTARAGGRAEGR